MTKRAAVRLTPRAFLKACGLAIAGAGVGQLVIPPKAALASVDTYFIATNNRPNWQTGLHLFWDTAAGYVAANAESYPKPLHLQGSEVIVETGASVYAEQLRVTSDGKVGVGLPSTTQPQAFLHLHRPGTYTTSLRLTNGNTGTGDHDGIELGVADDNGYCFLWDNEEKPLRIGTSGADAMVITSTGTVGIGTATPDAVRLHVANGDLKVTSGTILVGTKLIANANGCVYA